MPEKVFLYHKIAKLVYDVKLSVKMNQRVGSGNRLKLSN